MSRPTKTAPWWLLFEVQTPAEALAMIVAYGLSLPVKKEPAK